MAVGLTNEEYENWLQDTAADSCGLLQELITVDSGGSVTSYTDVNDICNFMNDTDTVAIADYIRIEFSGIDEENIPWTGVDARVTTNLERVQNIGDLPPKIKRPIGS